MADETYPVNLSVDYPDRPLDKVSTFFRLFAAIPIIIIIILLVSPNFNVGSKEHPLYVQIGAIATVFLPLVFMLLFRQKYPRWWYDWNYEFTKFEYRIGIYLLLLRDEYPSTDEEQAVHLTIPYPDAKALNRYLPLVKWFLAIPHYIVLTFLMIAALICVIIAWFAILFTGQYPRSLFDFEVGVQRWALRVTAYAFLLVTDEYPPFRLGV